MTKQSLQRQIAGEKNDPDEKSLSNLRQMPTIICSVLWKEKKTIYLDLN